MKRAFYIVCFAFLGLLLATILHGVIEMAYLAYIFGNPAQFAESVWWQEWPMIHHVGGAALWLAGFVLGAYGGVKYWRIIYVEGKRT